MNYEIIYHAEWGEYRIKNDHQDCSAAGFPYSPDFIYSFESKDEAEACAAQLRKWHGNSIHPSCRKEVNFNNRGPSMQERRAKEDKS